MLKLADNFLLLGLIGQQEISLFRQLSVLYFLHRFLS